MYIHKIKDFYHSNIASLKLSSRGRVLFQHHNCPEGRWTQEAQSNHISGIHFLKKRGIFFIYLHYQTIDSCCFSNSDF